MTALIRALLQFASLPRSSSLPLAGRMTRTADARSRTPRPTARLQGYVYRRPLSGPELLPAIGVGVATGLVAFYVARLFLQRTPLLPEERRVGKHHASGPRSA